MDAARQLAQLSDRLLQIVRGVVEKGPELTLLRALGSTALLRGRATWCAALT
jgi:hypothetical protein